MNKPDAAWPLGTVTVLGAHILDVLGRPVEAIPPGQGSARLKQIKATAAGTAAGGQGERRARRRRRAAPRPPPRDFERLAPLLAITDWFLPNGDQLRALTARDELGPAVKDVLALGTGGVAVTLGADGCLVTRPGSGGYRHLPALEVDVVDTTALWYFGGLLWRLKKGTAGVKPVEDLLDPAPPTRA